MPLTQSLGSNWKLFLVILSTQFAMLLLRLPRYSLQVGRHSKTSMQREPCYMSSQCVPLDQSLYRPWALFLHCTYELALGKAMGKWDHRDLAFPSSPNRTGWSTASSGLAHLDHNPQNIIRPHSASSSVCQYFHTHSHPWLAESSLDVSHKQDDFLTHRTALFTCVCRLCRKPHKKAAYFSTSSNQKQAAAFPAVTE